MKPKGPLGLGPTLHDPIGPSQFRMRNAPSPEVLDLSAPPPQLGQTAEVAFWPPAGHCRVPGVPRLHHHTFGGDFNG